MLKQVRIHHTNLIHDQDIGLFQCITFVRKNRIVIFLYRDLKTMMDRFSTDVFSGTSSRSQNGNMFSSFFGKINKFLDQCWFSRTCCTKDTTVFTRFQFLESFFLFSLSFFSSPFFRFKKGARAVRRSNFFCFFISMSVSFYTIPVDFFVRDIAVDNSHTFYCSADGIPAWLPESHFHQFPRNICVVETSFQPQSCDRLIPFQCFLLMFCTLNLQIQRFGKTCFSALFYRKWQIVQVFFAAKHISTISMVP